MKKTIITKKSFKATTLTVGVALLAISALLLTGCESREMESIALEHAGVSESDAKLITSTPDRENGKEVYEVEFVAHEYKYDYTIDADTGEVLRSEKTLIASAPASHSDGELITEEDAKSIALAHAKLDATSVTFIKTRADRDDGRQVYEIDFYHDGYEYEYEIDAATGNIVEFDKERERKAPAVKEENKPSVPENNTPVVSPPAEEPTAVNPPANQPAVVNEPVITLELITKEDAKSIALTHAGLDGTSVTYVKTEFDRDDGRYVYEVDFYFDGYEYEYDVDAESGKVLKYEKERENKAPVTDKPAAETPSVPENPSVVTPPAENKPEATAPEYIGTDRAKAIALEHAGITSDGVRFDGVELDREKGRYVYEVDFEYGVYEYEYEIDAESGEVIKHEKEIDD